MAVIVTVQQSFLVVTNAFETVNDCWLTVILNAGYSRFTFAENAIANLQKVPRAKHLGSDRLFCFISACKFGSFKNPFAMITSLPKLYFRFRKFILMEQTKKSDFYELWQLHKQLKIIEMSKAWPDTYNEKCILINSNLNPPKRFTSSSRSTDFKDILPWNISKDFPNQ